MPLIFSDETLPQIHEHCLAEYPLECCGVLLGTSIGPTKTIARAAPLINAESNSPERRFAIDPRRLLEVERSARSSGVEILGFYHSHPDAPARPSATDLEWAWPVYSYVIVSVASGMVGETRSYVLSDDTGEDRFVEEEMPI